MYAFWSETFSKEFNSHFFGIASQEPLVVFARSSCSQCSKKCKAFHYQTFPLHCLVPFFIFVRNNFSRRHGTDAICNSVVFASLYFVYHTHVDGMNFSLFQCFLGCTQGTEAMPRQQGAFLNDQLYLLRCVLSSEHQFCGLVISTLQSSRHSSWIIFLPRCFCS